MQEVSARFPGNLEFQIARRRNVVSDSTMKRFPEKIMALINSRGTSKAKVAQAIDADPSQFGKWTTGKLTPSAEQVLAIAREFGTTMEYFVDDEIEMIAAEGQSLVILTKEERYVIELYRDLGLDKGEAARRLSNRTEGSQPKDADSQPGTNASGRVASLPPQVAVTQRKKSSN